MTSKRQKKYRNKDFAKYYDNVTVVLLVISLAYLLYILFNSGIGTFFLLLIMGFFGYYIASTENRNPVRWFCFGLLLNIFVLFLRLIIEVKETDPAIVRSREFNKPKESLKKRKLLDSNENIVFQQTATYKGGISGYPQASEDSGIAFILDNAFVFYDSKIQFKLLFSKIIEAKLDFFQMSGVRGFLSFGDEGRQLQQTKNTIDICYFDSKNIERNAKFQIHGAFTISGEEVKAREFLNHLLEFKAQFMESNNQSLSQNKPQLDNFSKLEKLKQLKDRGIISDTEFETKKKQFLDEM